jgi:hypothetical protein
VSTCVNHATEKARIVVTLASELHRSVVDDLKPFILTYTVDKEGSGQRDRELEQNVEGVGHVTPVKGVQGLGSKGISLFEGVFTLQIFAPFRLLVHSLFCGRHLRQPQEHPSSFPSWCHRGCA